MKKIVKTSVVLMLSVFMLCAGIYAAIINRVGFNMNNYVYFHSADNVFVDVKGKITGGAMDTETGRNYLGKTYRDDTTESFDAEPWRIGGVAFIVVDGKAILIYTLEFTNVGTSDVDIEITIPSNLPDTLTLTGGLDTAGVVAEGTNAATVADAETAKFVYTLELTDLQSSLANTDVSFIISLYNTVAD